MEFNADIDNNIINNGVYACCNIEHTIQFLYMYVFTKVYYMYPKLKALYFQCHLN